jgi:Peptidase propeptide and YPEB domain
MEVPMKTLLSSTMIAAFLIGASSTAFAASSQAGEQHGTPPMHWVGDTEHAAVKALNDLEANGYSTFSNFHKKGNNFEATVIQHGMSSNVLIDPSSGSITHES